MVSIFLSPETIEEIQNHTALWRKFVKFGLGEHVQSVEDDDAAANDDDNDVDNSDAKLFLFRAWDPGTMLNGVSLGQHSH